MTSPPPFPEPQRIALVKPSALGDIMNSLPVLTALRQRFPLAHISWIVNRSFVPLLQGHRDLDEILPFERNLTWFRPISGLSAMFRFIRDLRRRRFDLVIDLQGLFRTGLIAYVSGAKRRVGLASAREGASWFYTEVVDDRAGSPHAVDRCWRVAEHFGAGQGQKQFHLAIEPAAAEWARNLLAGYPRPWLAVGAGSRWLTKRWPTQHFAELVRRAHRQFGGSVILIGAPDEIELAGQTATMVTPPTYVGGSLEGTPPAYLGGSLDGTPPTYVGGSQVLNLAGKTNLAQLTALLAQVDVLLANDTGPLHLAVALGRPVVAPYTCTKVSHNGPYGQFDNAVETRVHCQGSYLRKCDRLECMAELTPDRLWPTLHGILEKWTRHRLSA
jgi:ADP-heptose:LPS heptosyltransferase